jgi:NAD-dependent deacetylase
MINASELSKLEELRKILSRSGRTVFLGGAGTSTESGIPDFRSSDGVFAATRDYGFPPETLLSRSFFLKHTETFFDYYRKFLLYPDAKPNDCHRALAKMEREGTLAAVITQNIDGLHQKAGSKTVLELHGSAHSNHCMNCGRSFTMCDILDKTGIPTCGCGGVIKPDVVLYEEPLNEKLLQNAVSHMHKADTLIIGGTSLAVYPAAGLVDYFHGRSLVVINLGNTSRSGSATLTISAPIGEVLRRTVLEQPMAQLA